MRHARKRRVGVTIIAPPPPPPTDVVLTTSNTTLKTSTFEPGTVLIQNTLQMTPADDAIALLEEASGYTTFHTTMFGGEWSKTDPVNPTKTTLQSIWPTHNRAYNWERLDQRVARAEAANQKIIIHLGLTPTWMLADLSSKSFVAAEYNDGGIHEAHTNYDLNVAYRSPLTSWHDDFASMCGDIAARYAGRIWGYALWNENKGFWSVSLNRWRYEELTTLYNKIYAEVKAADPAAKMGGNYQAIRHSDTGSGIGYTAKPGAANFLQFRDEFSGHLRNYDSRGLDSVLYWWAHKTGADFFCYDGSRYSGDVIMGWIRAQLSPTIPVVVMEQYSNYPSWIIHPEIIGTDTAVANAVEPQARALFIENYRRLLMSDGYVTSCNWSPQKGVTGQMPEQAIWDSNQNRTNTTTWLGWMKTHFGTGKVLKVTTTNDPMVTIIATAIKVMVINRYEVSKTVSIDGVVKTIGANMCTLYDRPVV